MIIKAYMCAYAEGKLRNITIPEDEVVALTFDPSHENLLETAFKNGQNDFACEADLEQRLPSLSCGDVVKLHDGSLHVCLAAGWEQLPEGTKPENLQCGPGAVAKAYGFKSLNL